MGFFVLAVLVVALLAGFWVKRYVYASRFTPVELSSKEQDVLQAKLSRLESTRYSEPLIPGERSRDRKPPLKPEKYSEEGAIRDISLTEKELNAMIASDPEVASRVAIDLSENLVSILLVLPVDEGFPVLGGKTLRFNLGVVLGFADGQPVVALKGISLGGIPLPNAWLGNMKNRNLVSEFAAEGGFWKLFSDGVSDLKVRDGHILISLKE
ncbi:MAG TPA: arginine N-succinyltransferase [Geoalkalibacter subterraneus]|uniref:Arginine N-succinyltransferase n=1 Tax=Geoalkalibacter subterraneus TaxID=483547 RepID=A0A831LLT2_9BACT|nr:arginine N-succinyltransferase [Geoalkalibacter subterraneus]